MASGKLCPRCGTAPASTGQFCTACGARLERRPPRITLMLLVYLFCAPVVWGMMMFMIALSGGGSDPSRPLTSDQFFAAFRTSIEWSILVGVLGAVILLVPPARRRLRINGFGQVVLLDGGVAVATLVGFLVGTPASLPMSDGFSSGCNWPVGSNGPDYSYGCNNGRYQMTLQQEKGSASYHITQSFGFNSHALELQVDERIDQGVSPTQGALLGIGCLTDDHHGYVASVSTYGTWGIARFEDDFTWLTYKNKPATPNSDAEVRVGIVCAKRADGSTVIAVTKNGKLLGSTVDQPRPGFEPYNGAFLYANSWPGLASFDNFRAVAATPAEVNEADSNATHGEVTWTRP